MMLTAATAQGSTKPDYGYGEKDDFFILLGMASNTLSHRIYNVTGILGTCTYRLRGHIHCDNQAALDLVTNIDQNIKILGDFSRCINAISKHEEPPTPLDVNSLLYDVWKATFASNIPETVQVNFDLQENLPAVCAYSPLLADVFRTVIENSLEAIDETDKYASHINIRSRYTRASDIVEIEIEDNGVGIPQEILLKLFQGPVRSSKLSKGMGLWLARLIIARTGGEINVQDTKVGQGTTIRITLPAIQAADTLTDRDHD
jgi:signal transduction histidine kinase